MSRIWKCVQLDLRVMRSYYKVFILLYFLGAFIAVLAQSPVLAVPVVVVITAPVVGLFFSVYEKNNLSKLYGILPIGKSDVVVSLYVHDLIVGVANGLMATILAYVVALLVGTPVAYLTFAAPASFLYFCLFVSILLPLYFRYPYSKIYIVSNLPIYLLTVFSALTVRILARRNPDLLASLVSHVQYFTAHPEMAWVAGIGGGLVLLVISGSLSRLIYRKAEL